MTPVGLAVLLRGHPEPRALLRGGVHIDEMIAEPEHKRTQTARNASKTRSHLWSAHMCDNLGMDKERSPNVPQRWSTCRVKIPFQQHSPKCRASVVSWCIAGSVAVSLSIVVHRRRRGAVALSCRPPHVHNFTSGRWSLDVGNLPRCTAVHKQKHSLQPLRSLGTSERLSEVIPRLCRWSLFAMFQLERRPETFLSICGVLNISSFTQLVWYTTTRRQTCLKKQHRSCALIPCRHSGIRN